PATSGSGRATGMRLTQRPTVRAARFPIHGAEPAKEASTAGRPIWESRARSPRADRTCVRQTTAAAIGRQRGWLSRWTHRFRILDSVVLYGSDRRAAPLQFFLT